MLILWALYLGQCQLVFYSDKFCSIKKAIEVGLGQQKASMHITNRGCVTGETWSAVDSFGFSLALSLHTVWANNGLCHTNLDLEMD